MQAKTKIMFLTLNEARNVAEKLNTIFTATRQNYPDYVKDGCLVLERGTEITLPIGYDLTLQDKRALFTLGLISCDAFLGKPTRTYVSAFNVKIGKLVQECTFVLNVVEEDGNAFNDVSEDGVEKPTVIIDDTLGPNGSALARQVGGDHYKKYKIQPVEFIVANDIGYMEGNVIKYVVRHKDKNGIADLEKAKHYIDLLIEQYKQQEN